MQNLILRPSKKKGEGKRAFWEKCEGIYEKAIAKNRNNIKLIVDYLKCCENTKDYLEVLNLWSYYLRSNQGDLEFQMHYLEFRKTQHQSFNLLSYMKEFENCVAVYNKMHSEDKISDTEENLMVHIFSKVCRVTFESGNCVKHFTEATPVTVISFPSFITS